MMYVHCIPSPSSTALSFDTSAALSLFPPPPQRIAVLDISHSRPRPGPHTSPIDSCLVNTFHSQVKSSTRHGLANILAQLGGQQCIEANPVQFTPIEPKVSQCQRLDAHPALPIGKEQNTAKILNSNRRRNHDRARHSTPLTQSKGWNGMTRSNRNAFVTQSRLS